jgi:hypothetical protein
MTASFAQAAKAMMRGECVQVIAGALQSGAFVARPSRLVELTDADCVFSVLG